MPSSGGFSPYSPPSKISFEPERTTLNFKGQKACRHSPPESMNMTYFYVLLAIAAGAALSIQVGVNNALRTHLGSPIVVALVSFAVGSFCLLAYAVLLRSPWPSMEVIAKVPAWAWAGGALGAYFVASTITAAPHLGAASLISIIVTAQLLTSLALDHYGLISFAQHSMNVWRMLGALLLIAGVLLIVKN